MAAQNAHDVQFQADLAQIRRMSERKVVSKGEEIYQIYMELEAISHQRPLTGIEVAHSDWCVAILNALQQRMEVIYHEQARSHGGRR